MDIGKSLTFVFDDERWISKLTIGAGIFLLGLVGMLIIIGPFLASAILMGYMIAIARNVMRGDERPLPDWSGIGTMFVDGVKLLLAQFLWMLPLMILGLPLMIVAIFAGEEGADGVAAAAFACLGCFGFLYGILYMLVTPTLTVRLAETGKMTDALSFGGVLQFTRQNLAMVIVVLLVTIIAQMLAGFVGSLLCGVGLLFTTPWAYMVQGHLSGQLGVSGGAGPGAYEPVPPMDEPMPPVPADFPDDAEIVDEVKQQAEQVQGEWDEQAVRMDEPSEPLVWDDSAATEPEAPAQPAAPAEPEAPADPAPPADPTPPDTPEDPPKA